MTPLLAAIQLDWVALGGLATVLVAVGGLLEWVRRRVAEHREQPSIDELRRAQAEEATADAKKLAAETGAIPVDAATRALRASSEAMEALLVSFPRQIAALNARIEEMEREHAAAEEECARRIARLYRIIEEREDRRQYPSPPIVGGRRDIDPEGLPT